MLRTASLALPGWHRSLKLRLDRLSPRGASRKLRRPAAGRCKNAPAMRAAAARYRRVPEVRAASSRARAPASAGAGSPPQSETAPPPSRSARLPGRHSLSGGHRFTLAQCESAVTLGGGHEQARVRLFAACDGEPPLGGELGHRTRAARRVRAGSAQFLALA